jgi:hypothetical protein
LGDLQITNFKAGELVRYPVVILRGTTAAQDLAVGLAWKSMTHVVALGGKFVTPVELKPGINMVLLTSGDETLKFRLDYRPMTNPRNVACAYIAPKDEPTDYDAPAGTNPTLYGEHIDAAMKLLQGFTAEAMQDAGFGRKTFPLEFDRKGKVLVHVIRSDHPAQELRSMTGPNLLSTFEINLLQQFPPNRQKTCAFLSFSRYDPATNKLLAQCDESGGSIAMFDTSGFALWPTSIPETQNVFATNSPGQNTMAELLSGLLQTFGLPDKSGYFKPEETPRWDPESAAALNQSPWFDPDGR